MSFEYLAVNPLTGEKALAQVKIGEVILDRNDYGKYPHKVFLFQSNERYAGTNPKNVVCVSRCDLLEFLTNSLTWLPLCFKTKMEMLSQ
jgi:hypothetical protein